MSVAVERRFSGWKVAIVLYAVAAFAGLAGLLLTPGTIGHHWDWLIPSDPRELRHFAWTSGFAWQDFAFGSYVTYRYATTLTSFLFGAPGFVGLGGAFVTKALLTLSVFVSGAGMRFLLLTLSREDAGDRDGAYATFGGLLYALAPYAYNQIIAGDQSALISDAVAPIAIALMLRAARARDRIWIAYGLGAALLLAVIVASAQVFVFTIAIAWAICITLQTSGRTVARLALVTGAGAALCAFWIVPAFLAGGAVHTVVQTASVDRAFATLQQFTNPLLTLTTLAFPGDFYEHALGAGAPAFFVAYAALFALCVAALVKRRTPLMTVLAAIFLIFAFLPLGGNPAIGSIILAIFTAFLPYSLFLRTPQHMMFVVSLVFPTLVYLAARGIQARYFSASLIAAAFVFLAYAQGFFAHSRFFGLVGPFVETPGERATVAAASRPENAQYRTLFVPNAASYYYHPGVFDYYFEGADEAQVRFLPGDTMAAGSKWTPFDGTQALLKALDELVPDGAPPQTQTLLLKLAGVKNIVVHQIGVPAAGVRLAGQHSRPYLESALRASGVATFERSLGDRSFWRFDAPVTRAYAPDCIFGIPPTADPYDVLALAPASTTCRRPAAIVAPPSSRSEEIVPAAAFGANPQRGLSLGMPEANVETHDSGDGFVAVVPSGVQDVEMLRLPSPPPGAVGVAFRLSSSVPRRVWVQLYAPNFRNFYQTNVDFSGQVQDVAIDFDRFGRIGRPSLPRIAYLRFASRNGQLRAARMYFGAFRWIDRPASSKATPYLQLANNRWDQFYFGGDREHVLFEAVPGVGQVYAWMRLAHGGSYDADARVQEDGAALSLQLSVDGHAGACVTQKLTSDVTERLVRLAVVPLTAGWHRMGLRFCRVPPASKQHVGVRSLVFAPARFEPPARRASGTVQVAATSAGSIRVKAGGNLLVFTDSYDNRWTARQRGKKLQHVVVNGYANGWIVPHPEAGDVVLSFWPQRTFNAGIALTAALAAIALAAIGALLVLQRRHAALPDSQEPARATPAGGHEATTQG